MLLFGLVQIVVSQIPDFHNMEWLSTIAAIMSFTYAFIGLGLGFAKVIGIALNLPASFNIEIWTMLQQYKPVMLCCVAKTIYVVNRNPELQICFNWNFRKKKILKIAPT